MSQAFPEMPRQLGKFLFLNLLERHYEQGGNKELNLNSGL